jgi:Nuclease-related domain
MVTDERRGMTFPLLLGLLTTYGLLLMVILWGCLLRRSRRSCAHRRSRRRAGRVGEAKVTRLVQVLMAPTTARLLIDVTLPTVSGGTTQIDHILLTTGGIFVIEVKHWAGVIRADAAAESWEQSSLRGRVWLANPLQQNAHHCRVVRGLLGPCVARASLLDYVVVGLVVCTGSARPLSAWPGGMGDLAWLQRTLTRASVATLLDAATLERCARQLEAHRLRPGRATDRRHLRHVQRWLR